MKIKNTLTSIGIKCKKPTPNDTFYRQNELNNTLQNIKRFMFYKDTFVTKLKPTTSIKPLNNPPVEEILLSSDDVVVDITTTTSSLPSLRECRPNSLSLRECRPNSPPLPLDQISKKRKMSEEEGEIEEKEIEQVEKEKRIEKKEEREREREREQKKQFSPNSYDSLIWCFYIAQYGFSNYEINKNDQRKINDLKINTIELLRKKGFKQIKKIDDILDVTAIRSITHFYALTALCFAYGLNVSVIINNRIYIEFIGNQVSDEIHIFRIELHHFLKKKVIVTRADNRVDPVYCSIEYPVASREHISPVYRNQYLFIENVDKPLKGVSSYKADELCVMAAKLGLNIYDQNCKKKTKPLIYDEISACIHNVFTIAN